MNLASLGTPIIINNHPIMIPDGVETIRYTVHPLIVWLSKFFPIDPFIECERPKFRESDPVMFEGKIYMTQKQFTTLKAPLS